ncbi:MAG: hypothetical protein ACK41E_06760 [Deinococcales bacterium]
MIASLELPKLAIDAILEIFDKVTGQRYIDKPVFASSERFMLTDTQTPAEQFEVLLGRWKTLGRSLEQPKEGVGWFDELFEFMATLKDDELEQVFSDFATESPTG